MTQQLAHISVLIPDYDQAIAYYTQKLAFTLLEDTPLSETKRWVLIAPPGSKQPSILLAKSANEVQTSRIGNQTGCRVFLFLHTDDIQRDLQNLRKQEIKIIREPKIEPYGTVLVFEDLYGNLWDLIQPRTPSQMVSSTAVLKAKANVNLDQLKLALRELRQQTLLEQGVVQFDIQQSTVELTQFLVWERFVNQTAFQAHLDSPHLQQFLTLDLVTLERAYPTQDFL